MTFTFDLFLLLLGLTSMWQRSDGQTLGKPVIEGLLEGEVKTVVDLRCMVDEVPEGVTVLYQLYKESNGKAISETTGLYGGPGNFPVYVRATYDGRLICKASAQNNTEVKPSYSDPVHFRVLEKVERAHITSDPPSEEFWEGDSVTLRCSVTAGTYVSYEWLLNDRPVQLEYNRSQNHLTIQSLSASSNGTYGCVASNQLNGTLLSSSAYTGKAVRVKEHLSDLEISLELVKDGKGSLNAHVLCRLERGTPPVNFTLLLNNDNVGEEQVKDLEATFVVPIQLDQNMGLAQCHATDGTTVMLSKRLNLTVESVGGAVTMRVDRTVAHDSQVLGVWLRCSVDRGTFPHYSWFFNNTRLEKQGPFYIVLSPSDAVLAFILSPEAAGIYHCEAANAFDNTTRVASQRRRISKEVMNRVPLVVVIIVFTCFFLLIIALTACCLYGVVLRKKKARNHRHLKVDAAEMSYMFDSVEAEDEDDDWLSEDSYEEDMDVVEASRIEDSDEDEGSSVPEKDIEEENSLLDEETSEGAGAED